MQAVLMVNTSENNKIGKTLTNVQEVDVLLKEETSALDIVLELIMNTANLMRVNYLHIPSLGRYYFVRDIQIDVGNRYIIYCHVDVLETFREEILDLCIIANKTENNNKADLYIDDNSFVSENRLVNDVYNFPNGFNDDGEFILITVGA